MIAALPLVGSALSLLGPSATSATTTATQTASGAEGDFAQVMAKVTANAVNTVGHAESVSLDGLQGKANTQDVVQSVMSAQETLQTALAIRDKAVAAFQEMTKMSI